MALNQNPTGSDNKNELTVEQGVAKEEVKADIIENGEDLKIEIKNIFSMSNKYIENPYQCSADGCDYIARDNSVLNRHIRWRHAGKVLNFSLEFHSRPENLKNSRKKTREINYYSRLYFTKVS